MLMLLLLSCVTAQAERTISAQTYLDKLRGMWLGEVLGNYAGRPKEGQVQRGGLTYSVAWTSILQTTRWDGDDDTCFEYLYMHVLSGNADPTPQQIGDAWGQHVNSGSFYIANAQARLLMNYGESPPQTGGFARNMHAYAIDSQITTESLGAVAPGMRQRAADLAGRFAGVTNEGYSLHAAQFYSAMYSAAAMGTNVANVIDAGLEVVPATSRTYAVIRDVRNWYQADLADGTLDWRATQALLYDRYVGTQSMGRYRLWVESTVNVGATVLSLLYGQGDFKQTVEIGVQAGFDADCNPATAAGLLGMMSGYSGLPADLTAGATDRYQASGGLLNFTNSTTVSAIAAGFQSVAEQQILLAGGTITGEGAARTYHLPDSDPVAPPVERPDPTGPAGLVAAVRAVGGTASVSASIEQHISSNDRGNLDAVIDGITDVTYNGHVAYTTNNGDNAQPPGGDYYQITFDREATFAAVVFHEGDLSWSNINGDPRVYEPYGGYFLDLTVEVRSEGVFRPVTNLQFSEPLDPYKFYQVIELAFQPVQGDSIRIRGNAGGSREFTTIVELEAFGRLGLIPAGDATCDGVVDMGDLGILATNYGLSGKAWVHGDFNGDGLVDVGDLGILATNYGDVAAGGIGANPRGVPEPATLALLAAASAVVVLRRRGTGFA